MRSLLPLVCVVLVGCGEATWTMNASPETGLKGPAAPVKLSTFQGLNEGLPGSGAPTALAQLDGRLYLAQGGGLFTLGSGEQKWSPSGLALASGEQVTALARIELSLFVATTAGMHRYDWASEKFEVLTGAPKAGFGIAKRGNALLVATASGLFVSTNQGKTWSAKSSGAPFTTAGRALVAAAAQEKLFVVDAKGALWSSDDQGASWSANVVEGEVTSISAAGAFVLLTTPTGSMRSDNYGNTFKDAALGDDAFSLALAGEKAFAGTRTGVRVSDDGGDTWRDGSEGLPAGSEVRTLLTAGSAVLAHTNGSVWVAQVQ